MSATTAGTMRVMIKRAFGGETCDAAELPAMAVPDDGVSGVPPEPVAERTWEPLALDAIAAASEAAWADAVAWTRLELVSRCKRLRSARSSAALW